MKQSYVYILKCSDGSYYAGVTSNLESRLFKHNSGFYPESYTSSRRPLELVFIVSLQILIWQLTRKSKLRDGHEPKKKL